MKRTAKILFIFGVITVITAVFNFADAVNALQNLSNTPLESYLRGQATIGLILWLGVGITQIAVSYTIEKSLHYSTPLRNA
ncbi:hypothetical protein G4O51_12400 [Candidatus Bathyarchaeota archaeon A05DMB-2]|jgi:hypothetical protein|nr:hypothetical protein [Candidatus Bathyarchaeota archaeon A05DMB-2]